MKLPTNTKTADAVWQHTEKSNFSDLRKMEGALKNKHKEVFPYASIDH